jgi:hypothetical protein
MSGETQEDGQSYGIEPSTIFQSITDPDTHFSIIVSQPGDDDGCRVGEPTELVCDACGAATKLTREPSAGIDDFPHRPDCPQRFTHWGWYLDVVDDGHTPGG